MIFNYISKKVWPYLLLKIEKEIILKSEYAVAKFWEKSSDLREKRDKKLIDEFHEKYVSDLDYQKADYIKKYLEERMNNNNILLENLREDLITTNGRIDCAHDKINEELGILRREMGLTLE